MSAFRMPNSSIQTITSLATTYTYLGEDLIEEILIMEPDQPDLVRAASALRLARRALGCSIIAPMSLQFSNAENAAENCEILKVQLAELMGLSPSGASSDSYYQLVHLHAVDIYTMAARIAFLLSKDKTSQFN